MIMNLYRNIDREKVQFDFVENTSEEAAFDQEILRLGGRIFRCPHYTGCNHFLYRKWWIRFLRDYGQDYSIVHGHLGSTAAIYLKIANRFGLFTIAHSHNTNLMQTKEDFLYAAVSFPVRYIADYFFACSQMAGKSRYGKKIASGNCYALLNNAIDAKSFAYNQGERESWRDRFALGDSLVVGHIGRFNEQKNHRFLLEIFKEVQNLHGNAKLLLVGDGDLRKEIESRAEELEIRDRIIFAGVRSEIPQIVQAMDVFLFPSLYEGLPVTLVEAQAAGLPCVISDRITREIMLTDLIRFCSLEEVPCEWAKCVLQAGKQARRETTDEIISSGYDIRHTTEQLTAFYLAHQ